jgi:hypothetical protein
MIRAEVFSYKIVPPLFSTIIPAYNRERYIGAAIESALAQSCADHEIIVVDDGSTDRTREVVARFGERVQLLVQSNAGPGAARNLGIHHATGRYITFLDSDDLWFPWTLATYEQAIRSSSEPSEPSFIAGTGIDFVDGKSPPTSANVEPFEAVAFQDYFETAKQPVWIGTCAACVRREILSSVGGFSDNHINAEDSDLWLRLGTSPGFVRVVSPPLFAYRRHAGSAIANIEKSIAGTRFLIAQETAGRYPGGPARRLQRREIVGRHVRPVSVSCAKLGHLREAWDLYRQTLSWHIAMGRNKFVFGLPIEIARSATRLRRHSSPTPGDITQT